MADLGSAAIDVAMTGFNMSYNTGKMASKMAKDYLKYQHEWLKTDETINEPGAYIDSKENDIIIDDDDTKNQSNTFNPTDDAENEDEKIGVLVIGNTGTGKSSIIGLLSGQKTSVSSGDKRGTDAPSTIQSNYNSNIYFIDTVGLQDSGTKWGDPKLLKKTLKYIHYQRFRRIKIIICVSGETNSRKGLFGHLAQYVGKLSIDDETEISAFNPTDDEIDEKDITNVWDSVLIIKKGTKKGIDEDIDDFSGVISAATDNGATKQFQDLSQIFGFTCTDWMSSVKTDKVYKKLNSDEYEEFGYFLEKSAKKIIENKLNKVSSFELKFTYHKCCRCGVEGDPRYITAACHTKDDYFHTRPLEWYHIGDQKPKHTGQLTDYLMTSGYMHFGHKIKPHTEQIVRYHPGTIQKSSVKRVVAFVFTLSLSEWFIWKGREWHWHDCCNEYVGNATPCAKKWSCCNEPAGVQRCTNAYALEIWTCCEKRRYAYGCREIKKNQKQWDCCDQTQETNGCKMFWNCCKKDLSNKGCKVSYPCCKQPENSIGCKRKCVNCKIDWGYGPGCVETKN